MRYCLLKRKQAFYIKPIMHIRQQTGNLAGCAPRGMPGWGVIPYSRCPVEIALLFLRNCIFYISEDSELLPHP